MYERGEHERSRTFDNCPVRVGIIEPVPYDADDTRALVTLGRLTRGALHELANPLVALLGSAELALGTPSPDEAHARIARPGARAEVVEIVRALQAFVRLQSQPPEELSVGDAAADAVALVARVLPATTSSCAGAATRRSRRAPARSGGSSSSC